MLDKPQRLRGTLTRIHAKGFGFVRVAGRGDYFVHVNEMPDRADWVEGTELSFVPGPTEAGKAPPAHDVVAIHKEPE